MLLLQLRFVRIIARGSYGRAVASVPVSIVLTGEPRIPVGFVIGSKVIVGFVEAKGKLSSTN